MPTNIYAKGKKNPKETQIDNALREKILIKSRLLIKSENSESVSWSVASNSLLGCFSQPSN